MKYKMLHTCLRVKDLEKSLEFYTKALGLKETRRKDFPEHEFTLVFLADEAENHEIELTYNYNQEKPYTIGDGFSHMALSVEDLEASQRRHKEMGYEVTELMGLPGSPPRYYFLTDPDGYEVEIIRRA
ncbi:lactoylglutathione lyase [Isachenkonia alkalipeptolytica]|uniref:Aldoketomutase n=1 Tax=Isachenkonia alkalipeptolytica TaxID=2565777 RepID=A0AA43XKD6_9CLOT|nr:VOC family protein [Isachenkonia alkalipeptolytica]NBG88428.1 lactoylglutathione lyase [Isachenkonia alkalipeptolytica]